MNSNCPVCKKEHVARYVSEYIICDKCVLNYGVRNTNGDLVNVGIEDGFYYCEHNGDYTKETDFTINGVNCYAISCGVYVFFVTTLSIPKKRVY